MVYPTNEKHPLTKEKETDIVKGTSSSTVFTD